MNASQRRVFIRSILRDQHAQGNQVIMPTGKQATIVGASVKGGGSLMVKRKDNRTVAVRVAHVS